MVATSDFKKGLKIVVDNEPYIIVDFQHIKPGKGNQFTRTKLKHLVTGQNLERTIKSGEKFDTPDVAYVDMAFLYKDDNGYNFMNNENYEQLCLSDEVVGDGHKYMTENMEVKVCLLDDRAVGIELPITVQLKVTQTDPGFKGNTVSNTTKPATLETGHVVQVPLHTNEGDVLKIDTRSGEYMERVSLK